MATARSLNTNSPRLTGGPSTSSFQSSTGAASYAERTGSSPSPAVTRTANSKSSNASTFMATVKQQSTTGRLHKRASSASSVPHSPTVISTPLASEYQFSPSQQSAFLETTPSPIRSDAYGYAVPSPSLNSSGTKPKAAIRPFLRKLKSHEANKVDLSRSSTETDDFGIYGRDYGSGSRTATDVTFASAGKRGASHNRSISGTSQFSTTTTASGNRQYVHPMRQTPRPYTPPIAQSYQASMLGSEYSGEGNGQATDEEEHLRQIVRDASYRSSPTPTSSLPQAPPLRIHTNNSLTQLVNTSQTNVSSTPMSFRPLGDAASPLDAASPVSRTSLDRAFRMRSKDTSTPASRAASIQAARQAFSEKEALKDQRLREEETRAAQREERKREKRIEAARRKAAIGDKESRSRSKGNAEMLKTTSYASLTQAGNAATSNEPRGPANAPRRANTSATAKNQAQSTWVGFMIWLKTRILKLGRKMSGG
ncbi:MAG: hypothetical protein M1825_001063 [Sarcosagium campestre]|nr:MAG: hypothetical protein M1825_001063 [Sarcosagium campestre]